MRRGIILVVAIVLVGALVGIIVHRRHDNQTRYEIFRDRIQRIELGMSKEDVLAIMGEPKARITDPPAGSGYSEVWFFEMSRVASEPPRCHFDSEGKVITVVCGDNYRISADTDTIALDSACDSSVVHE